MDVIEKLVYKTVKVLQRNSATILTGASCLGLVGTAVLAIKATPKAIEIIDELKREKTLEIKKTDIALATWKCYIPTALVGGTTLACIIGSNVLNKQTQTSLYGAYALLEQSYKNYRKSAGNVFGEDADKKIRMDAAHEAYIYANGTMIYDPSTDDSSELMLFFDEYSVRYFTSTMAAVLNAQYHANRMLILQGELCLNTYYKCLGLDLLECGDIIGWGCNFFDTGYMWLDFENAMVTMDDGLECCIIATPYGPEPLYPDSLL